MRGRFKGHRKALFLPVVVCPIMLISLVGCKTQGGKPRTLYGDVSSSTAHALAPNPLPAADTPSFSIANRSLGAKRISQKFSHTNTWCKTEQGGSFFNGIVQYQVTEVQWELTPEAVIFMYRYEGTHSPLGAYDSPDFVFKRSSMGIDEAWYKSLRKQIKSGSVTASDAQRLIAVAHEHNGYLKACKSDRW